VTQDLYHAIFHIASALEVPVILLALAALVIIVVDFGAFLVELNARRNRRSGHLGVDALTDAATSARLALNSGAREAAEIALRSVAWSAAMDAVYAAFIEHAHRPGADNLMAKDLADFEFDRQRRLGRTRLLVRIGPALGLMGTLIPLVPALDGLARGDVKVLTDNLRVAFSVTVLGLFVGALAFLLSLVRERLYGQDYSDLEYVASVLTNEDPAFDRVIHDKPDTAAHRSQS
jgi:biopolymer transport protein ExbB/TolQ